MNNEKQKTKTVKMLLFVSLIVAMIMPFSITDVALATSVDIKIKEFEQKALRDNKVPSDELLKRVGDKWLPSYKDAQHFEISEEAVNRFVERNSAKEDLNREIAKLISEIHNFETITESVGHGHEIVLLVAQLEKDEGRYTPSKPISKYHDWIKEQHTIPTTKDGLTDRLTEIIGDWKFIDLAKKHADNFNKLAVLGNVPIDLFNSDIYFWGEVAHIAHCEHDPKCDVDALKHQPGATQEEIEKIRQIEAEVNGVSFDLWDIVLPKAYAWTKVQVVYDLFGRINMGACYYLNCTESWMLVTRGADSIDYDSYGYRDMLEHVYRGYHMNFYGKVCDKYTGSEIIINEVQMTPYLAQALRPDLSDSGMSINNCAYASHRDPSASHPFIVGILVESPGSYYWTNP